ncbi:SRPBCC family protein [Ralstonia soli]|uniref:Carbon monoxide dehydrogenase subunit G n=1 Tax=Ralstonia soli TaxID=2953896 RepID=A0ABT1AK84_9RALS|nr:carbon monoxide dehydrogenase subunit G [Ralstonia soli]MCO5398810.1 carbon monoxide dehydrogenase subunit G [Ralstonia soli]
MELTQTHLLPVPLQTAWDALNDPAVLQRCIPGCESLTATGDGNPPVYDIAMLAAVGPVKARFKGRMEVVDVMPPRSYTLHFDGQGGAAGFGKGSAQVELAPEGPTVTRLSYTATAQVGGKLAQIGSRLIDGAARKLADEFFQRFAAEFGSAEAAADAASPVDGMRAEQAIPDLAAGDGQAHGAQQGRPPNISPVLQPRNPWPWIIVALVAVVAAYLFLHHGA